jgi:hypothetical protein
LAVLKLHYLRWVLFPIKGETYFMYQGIFDTDFDKYTEDAVELFKEARAHLDDIARVDRILLELGKFYNPLVHGPIVDLATRRRIVEHLEAARTEDALRLLDERLALYARMEQEG